MTKILGGRYRIDALLGEGATGTVSRGHDTLLGRPVAIKILTSAYGRDAEIVERFYVEARTAARIVDAHVVAIYDIVSDGSTHAIVMECIDGPSLATVLKGGGTLNETLAIEYSRQIARALGAAHAQQIVHRDLKPANVLRTAAGVLKVTDFGLARAFGRSDLTIDSPGSLVGSVHYFSPEQALGHNLGPSSDLYSLGIMLYEFCFGTVPFIGNSAVAIALAHVERPEPAVAELERGMSLGLARIVARLLQKDPHERFRSASDVEFALAALVRPPTAAGGSYATDAPTLVGMPAVAMPKRGARARTSPKTPGIRARLAARKQSISPRMLAIGAGLLVLVLFVVALTRPKSIAVADVRGASVDRARSKLIAGGLRVETVRRSDRLAGAGVVIAQNPPAGSSSTTGSTVALTVSSGLPLLAIPNLIGTTFADAVARLKPVKLHVRYAAAYADAAANSVIEQIPSPGTLVRQGSNAIVVISTGSTPRVTVSSGLDGGD